MNKQENSEAKSEAKPAVKLEDLPVNEATTEQIKGGPGGGIGRDYE